MIIGVPKEIMHDERRVAATPETVAKLVADGAKVLVEAGAGEGAFYHDDQYAASGAEIIADVADLYAKADLILKVKEPLFNEEKNCHEIDMMNKGQYIINFIPVSYTHLRRYAWWYPDGHHRDVCDFLELRPWIRRRFRNSHYYSDL